MGSSRKGAKALALWRDLAEAGAMLLRGEQPDRACIQRLNSALGQNEEVSEEDLLPFKPLARRGETARRVAYAAGINDECGLRGAVGKPVDERWRERFRAAGYYDAITMGAALDRLTFGTDTKGLGASASLGRLLAHYPREFARDAVFLALAGLEAEAWNGHTYVEGFFALAECVHRAGFTLVAYPAALAAELRADFGIKSDGGTSSAAQGRAAEVFLDIDGVLRTDACERALAWLEKRRAEGLVLRAEADGKLKLTSTGGSSLEPVDRDGLEAAARGFWPRAAFATLGLPDLLEPGEFDEPASFLT